MQCINVAHTHTHAHTRTHIYDMVCVHFTGSTDVVSCSVHGVRDPPTAAMHIVLGKLSPYLSYNARKIILIIQFIVTRQLKRFLV